ncbi:hypothetical protein SeLEV6574_g02686 [Synchytrium endobioticum]|uniref:Methyltransferase FkbM domain-containing protein n=1 Tax=Synchytrium endobioticum TaxID=286115 RepID=A0A507D772_9FUNG|nr:hypothetical protein SeLEV6574_g02686 [Synchytrium endobioticum]
MSLPIGILVGVMVTLLIYQMRLPLERYGRSESAGAVGTKKSPYISASPSVKIASLLQFTYNIGEHELKVFSQNGEDGILHYIFSNIGHGDKYYVEFGTQNGVECNTRLLYENNGWDGLLMDGDGVSSDARVIHNHMITPNNIVEIFQMYNVPKKLSLLSVDIDSFDYWVLKSIMDAEYQPRVIVMEINRNFDINESYTVNSTTPWVASRFGFSQKAAKDICNKYGYHMVHTDRNGVNVVCISRITLSEVIQEKTGYMVLPDELKNWLPPFSHVYRRHLAIHVKNYQAFRDAFVKESKEGWWVKLDDNAEVMI